MTTIHTFILFYFYFFEGTLKKETYQVFFFFLVIILFKVIPGNLGIIEVLHLLTSAETRVQSPAAMPLALWFSEPIWECTVKLKGAGGAL